ncbi:MAG: hypothetical protein KKG60_02155 [Nanoarchaeota archaeon]|nr:hypothetical protein [Nanoarchaeota archaeon]
MIMKIPGIKQITSLAIILLFALFITSGCIEKVEVPPYSEASCDGLELQEKQECLEGVKVNKAVVYQDASFCETIIDEFSRRECTITVIMTKASVKADQEICNELLPSNAHKLQVCKDNALFAKARMKKDPIYCDQIQNQNTKQSCLDYGY